MANGSDILKIAFKHEGEKYVLGASVPKNNSNWKGPWDCAEFISWVIYQASGILYGCDNNSGNPAFADAYTGYWGRDAKLKGIIIKVNDAAATPGAVVLRLAAGTKLGHIVFSDGKGGTIEAHSTKKGVIKNTLEDRRWDMGILVPGIDYQQGGNVVVNNNITVYRMMHPMMKGEVVKKIQMKLASLGFDPGKIDGVYGAKTTVAVSAFQTSEGLLIDGEAGPQTLKALGI